jgi:hypothetical protein
VKRILSIASLWLAVLLLASCAQTPQLFGVLEGHVTIGPLVPVMREGEVEPTPAPEVYAAREIVVFMPDGKTEVARLQIDAEGNYGAELPAGFYIVDINHTGIDSAEGLPTEIEVTADGVIRLDIDIDTGIR